MSWPRTIIIGLLPNDWPKSEARGCVPCLACRANMRESRGIIFNRTLFLDSLIATGNNLIWPCWFFWYQGISAIVTIPIIVSIVLHYMSEEIQYRSKSTEVRALGVVPHFPMTIISLLPRISRSSSNIMRRRLRLSCFEGYETILERENLDDTRDDCCCHVYQRDQRRMQKGKNIW